MTDRLAQGYQPDFDIDAKIGHQGVLFSLDIATGIADGSIEVKTDEMAARTGNVYIEHACLRRDGWHPSGIATTQAEFWVFVVGGSILIAAPVAAVKEAHGRALALGNLRSCLRGSHPTKGAVVQLGAFVTWCLDSTVGA